MNVEIRYNPYKMETVFLCNGTALQADKLVPFQHEHLQDWVERLPKSLFDVCNVTALDVTFVGTRQDYQDVEEAFQVWSKAEPNKPFTLSLQEAKSLDDTEAKLRELYDQVEAIAEKTKPTPEVRRAFETALAKHFEVMVMGTLSSGKSTLINSLLGLRLMPTSSSACTATLTRVFDCDTPTFSAMAYDSEGQMVEEDDSLTFLSMKKMNEDSRISRIDIEGDIPFVRASEETALVLVDTPGPNNDETAQHRTITMDALDKSSKTLVLFLIDGDTQESEDEIFLLEEIGKAMKCSLAARERFLFVVSKMDKRLNDFDEEEYEDKDGSLSVAQTRLAKYGIVNPRLFYVSASVALELRRKWRGETIEKPQILQSNVKKMCGRSSFHFENRAGIIGGVPRAIREQLNSAVDDEHRAEVHTGIPSLEEAIRLYVEKYARPQKVAAAVKLFDRQLKSVEALKKAEAEVAEKAQVLNEVAQRLQELQERCKTGEEMKGFKSRIEGLDAEVMPKIRENFDDVKLRTQKALNELLNQNRGVAIEVNKLKGIQASFNREIMSLQMRFQNEAKTAVTTPVTAIQDGILKDYRDKLELLGEELGAAGLTIDLKGILGSQLENLPTFDSFDDTTLTNVEKNATTRWVEKKRESKWGQKLNSWGKRFVDWLGTETGKNWFSEQKTEVSGEDLSDALSNISGSFDTACESFIEDVETKVGEFKQTLGESYNRITNSLNDWLAKLGTMIKEKESASAAEKEARRQLEELRDITRKLGEILEMRTES